MIILLGLPHIFLLNSTFPSCRRFPTPSSTLTERCKGTRTPRRLLSELSDACCWFKNCFGFHALPRICHTSRQRGACYSAFPAAKHTTSVCLPRSLLGADSWERAALFLQKGQSTGGRVIWVFWCWLSSDHSGSFLAPLQMLFSSWKLVEKVSSNAGAGGMMHVLSWSRIIR